MTLELLRSYGANVDDGLNRCMNNESFYLKLIRKAIGDASFEALGKALDAKDPDAAFEEAHKLKGVFGNLSLTPIYEPLSALTELLRHKTPGDYAALYACALEKQNELKELLEK